MRKLRKGWWILSLAVVVLVGGGLGIKQYVTMKVGKSVATMAQDPAVKKAINQAIQHGGGQQNVAALLADAAKQAGNGNSSATASASAEQNTATSSGTETGQAKGATASTEKNTVGVAASGSGSSTSTASQSDLHFQNSNQALSYAMSKFTPTQVAQYLSDYENRNNLSPSEREQLKQQVLSKFTANELVAIEKAMAQ